MPPGCGSRSSVGSTGATSTCAARTVTVLGKGAKQRRVPVHDAAVAALRAWLDGGT